MGMTDRHEKTLTDMAEAMSYGGAVPGMCHFRRSGEPVPSQDAVKRMVGLCRSIIFPGFFGESDVSRYNVRYHAGLWIEELYEVLVDQITAGLCAVADCCAAPDIHAIAADAGERAREVRVVASRAEAGAHDRCARHISRRSGRGLDRGGVYCYQAYGP